MPNSFYTHPGNSTINKIAHSDDGQYILVASTTDLRLSTDGGDSFDAVTGIPTGVNWSSCDMQQKSSGVYVMLACTATQMWISSDSGTSWALTGANIENTARNFNDVAIGGYDGGGEASLLLVTGARHSSNTAAHAAYYYDAGVATSEYQLQLIVNDASTTGPSATDNTRVGISVALSGDGNYMVTGSSVLGGSFNGGALIYQKDGPGWNLVHTFLAPTGGENGRRVAISQDGSVVVVGGLGNVAVLRRDSNGNYTQEFGNEPSVLGISYQKLALSQDGNLLVAASQSGEVRVYRFYNSTWIEESFAGGIPTGGTKSVNIKGDGSVIMVAGIKPNGDSGVALYQKQNGSWQSLASGLDSETFVPSRCTYSSDGKVIAYQDSQADAVVVCRESSNGSWTSYELKNPGDSGTNWGRAIGISQDGGVAVVASYQTNRVYRWSGSEYNMDSQALVEQGLAFSLDNKAENLVVGLWNASGGGHVAVYQILEQGVSYTGSWSNVTGPSTHPFLCCGLSRKASAHANVHWWLGSTENFAGDQSCGLYCKVGTHPVIASKEAGRFATIYGGENVVHLATTDAGDEVFCITQTQGNPNGGRNEVGVAYGKTSGGNAFFRSSLSYLGTDTTGAQGISTDHLGNKVFITKFNDQTVEVLDTALLTGPWPPTNDAEFQNLESQTNPALGWVTKGGSAGTTWTGVYYTENANPQLNAFSADSLFTTRNGGDFYQMPNYIYLSSFDGKGKPFNLNLDENGADIKRVVSQELLNEVSTHLPEGKTVVDIHPDWIRKTVLNVIDTAEMTITFVSEGAGYRNGLSYYVYDPLNPPTRFVDIEEIYIIFPNASAQGSGGSMVAGDTVKLPYKVLSHSNGVGTTFDWVFPAGCAVAFVIHANQWSGSSLKTGHLMYSSDPVLNPESKSELREHFVNFQSPSDPSIVLYGAEDIRRTVHWCDHDFNDLVFFVTPTPLSSVTGYNSTTTQRFEGTMFCEDLYNRANADLDYNDLILEYEVIETLSSERVKSIQFTIKGFARGATLDHEFGVVIPNIKTFSSCKIFREEYVTESDTSTVSSITSDIIGNGTDRVPIINRTQAFLPGSVWATNTIPGDTLAPPSYAKLLIIFPGEGVTREQLNYRYFPYNFYLRVFRGDYHMWDFYSDQTYSDVSTELKNKGIQTKPKMLLLRDVTGVRYPIERQPLRYVYYKLDKYLLGNDFYRAWYHSKWSREHLLFDRVTHTDSHTWNRAVEHHPSQGENGILAIPTSATLESANASRQVIWQDVVAEPNVFVPLVQDFGRLGLDEDVLALQSEESDGTRTVLVTVSASDGSVLELIQTQEQPNFKAVFF